MQFEIILLKKKENSLHALSIAFIKLLFIEFFLMLPEMAKTFFLFI